MTKALPKPALQSLLRAGLPLGAGRRLLFDEPMCRRTTFQVGGPADAVYLPASADDIAAAFRLCRTHGIELTVLGNGSNVVVSDEGIRGLTVLLSSSFSDIRVQPLGGYVFQVEAQAGATMSAVAGRCCREGLTGMEFAAGIPGTIGGAVYMNAGAYDGNIAGVMTEADVLDPDLRIRTCAVADLGFGYRHSALMDTGSVLLSVRLSLHKRDPEQIRERIRELAERRCASQPLEMPSAGSTFRRPPDHFAGRLISDCGLRGSRVGGAQVSEKHAGFIVNTDRRPPRTSARWSTM